MGKSKDSPLKRGSKTSPVLFNGREFTGRVEEAIMPKFKISDHVERIGVLVPEYMRDGVVIRVIPNKNLPDWLTE